MAGLTGLGLLLRVEPVPLQVIAGVVIADLQSWWQSLHRGAVVNSTGCCIVLLAVWAQA